MRCIAVVSIALTACACATITGGTNAQVQIQSNPAGAQAQTSMGLTCITPCTIQISGTDEFTVVLTKPGFHTVEIPVHTQVASAGAAGNLVSVALTPRKMGEPDRVMKITPEMAAPKPAEVSPKT